MGIKTVRKKPVEQELPIETIQIMSTSLPTDLNMARFYVSPNHSAGRNGEVCVRVIPGLHDNTFHLSVRDARLLANEIHRLADQIELGR